MTDLHLAPHADMDMETDDARAAAARARGQRRLRTADLVVSAFAFALCAGIVANALVLQVPPGGTSPLPPHRPQASAAPAAVPAAHGGASGPATASAAPARPTGGATEGTLGYLVSRTVSAETPAPAARRPAGDDGLGPLAALADPSEVTGAVRPPADVPGGSRVLAVQRTLSRLGYGPLKVDGRAGAQTRLAVERFQHDRNLPADGQISDRLVRELSAVSGQAVE